MLVKGKAGRKEAEKKTTTNTLDTHGICEIWCAENGIQHTLHKAQYDTHIACVAVSAQGTDTQIKIHNNNN